MERLVINTGSSIGAGDGNNFRFALQQTEGNFTTLYDNPFPLPFPFTGSAQMTASAGQTDAVLIVTGAQDPGFAPTYSPAIEISGTENYISGSKIIWNNGIYGYLSNLQQGDANDESYFELAGSSQWFFKPGSFNNTILFSNSSNLISFNSNANSSFEGFIYGQVTNYPLISFKVASNQNESNRIGINKSNPTSTMELEINGGISASAYFASQIPNVDPEDSTKWFHANSDEVFGIPGNRILCKSQGSGPLVTDGLKYMLAPEIVITHLDLRAEYISPANNFNYYFSSSIRYGAQMPTASTWNQTQGDNESITSFQTANFTGNPLPRPLYYFDVNNSFISSLRRHVRIDNTIFENGASTLIFWWHPIQNTGTRNRYLIGCDPTSFSIVTKGSTFANPTGNENLYLNFGGANHATIPYFALTFPVDVDDWVMFALVFEGSSGAVDYKTFFSGSTGGYQQSGTTLSGFSINDNDFFKIGLCDGLSALEGGHPLDLSCFLYYSRSISEAEFTDIYHYFSGSHGYNQ